MPRPGGALRAQISLELDDRSTVAVFRSPMFSASEGFIQTQALSLKRYQPLMIGLYPRGHVRPELEHRRILLASPRLGLRAGRLPDELIAAAPRLVHAHFATDGLVALPIAEALGAPLVTSLRGYDVAVRPLRMLVSGRASWMRYALFRRRLMRRGSLFLAVSDALRELALARGFPPERTFTHYNGVNLKDHEPGPPGPRAPLVLHVGRLVQKKGTSTLLKAFAEVLGRHPGAELAIIGEGPLDQPLHVLASELGLGDRVRFLGALPHEDVKAWMARAALLAAPSQTAASGDGEGLPNVVVEAAAMGLPVVATLHGGIPEAVIDGDTGFLVPERQSAALAERILHLLGSPELGREMGRRARVLAEAKFDLERQAERLEAHYDGLLAAASGAGRP